MPSVTINEKGIVSESGSGFSVNDGPLLPHVESMVDSASFTLQCQLHDDGSILEGDPGYLNSLNGTVDDGEEAGTFVGLYASFQDGAGSDYYVWFNVDAACTDPGTFGDATGTGFEVAAAAADINTLDKVSALVAAAIVSGFSVTDEGGGSGQVTLVSLAMGEVDSSALVSDQLVALGDDPVNVSWGQVTQPTSAPSTTGETPATRGSLKPHGVSVLGSTVALAHTVILPPGAGAGAKKTLISSAWSAGSVTVAATMRSLADRTQNSSTLEFTAADGRVYLLWNSVDELWELSDAGLVGTVAQAD